MKATVFVKLFTSSGPSLQIRKPVLNDYPLKIFPPFQGNSSGIPLKSWEMTGKWLEQMEPLEFL